MTAASDDARSGAGRLVWLLVGVAAVAGGTLLGWDARLLDAIASPPPIVRAGLVGGSVVVALWLLGQATARLRAGTDGGDASGSIRGGQTAGRDVRTMIRGVRLVFLAVAALAAGVGWLLGHPLPFVIALVIAGVDLLETSFLLLVVSARGER